ncbi:unnamed protein product [Pleuronectes platessa]|uniref:Uncharacterized protein n=1 Tax=Pleuronectes platessa TaxID=8262 RepID=A0A9N7VMU7_PLEPL|nr:unnamed protein product [Pleuronectes platessa]
MSAWESKAVGPVWRSRGGEDRRTVHELRKFPSLHSSDENGRRSEAGFLYTMMQSLHITLTFRVRFLQWGIERGSAAASLIR